MKFNNLEDAKMILDNELRYYQEAIADTADLVNRQGPSLADIRFMYEAQAKVNEIQYLLSFWED